MGEIHASAIVDPSAKLGAGVRIGPYSVIGPNVVLADNVWVGPHVVIEGYTSIGEGSQIFQFASVGSRPQDLKFAGEKSTLEIGRENVIREYVTIQPGTAHGGMKTIVGDRNLFMACSHVGHDCRVGSRNIFANNVGLSGHVTIFDNVIMGGGVGIHQYVRIGSLAMISGGSMVGQDVPPFCIAQGDRCFLRGVNTIGLQRADYDPEAVAEVKKVYRLLFGSVGNLKEKQEQLPLDLATKPHIKVMLEFLSDSQRGVTSSAKSKSTRD